MSDNTKKCPFCAEEINIEAIKCKHCGSMLSQPAETNNANYENIVKNFSNWLHGNLKNVKVVGNNDLLVYIEWQTSNFSILITLILFFFFIIPGVLYILYCFMNPKYIIKGTVKLKDDGSIGSIEKIPTRDRLKIMKYNKFLKNTKNTL